MNIFRPGRRARRWQQALCAILAMTIACAPAAARGPGRAGVGALVDDLDGALPQGGNVPVWMRPAFEQLIPLVGDGARVSGRQFGVNGDIPVSVSPDAIGGAPEGMTLGAPQFSAEGDLVVPLLNIFANATVNGRPAVPAVAASFGQAEIIPKLPALRSVEIPPVPGIGSFISNRKAAIELGKAFFWDSNIGSDGNACASCHFAAGADNRLKNQLSPGLLAGDSVFSRHLSAAQRRAAELRARADAPAPGAEPKRFRGMAEGGGGPNYSLRRADFPFYRLADPLDRNSAVVFESNDVVSSQGTFSGPFAGSSGAAESCGNRDVDEFSVHGALTRRVAPRNSPTVINAIFNFRNFWDGRANNVFNGVSPFGDRDPDARVLERKPDGSVQPVRIALSNASLASQAVGPALSEFEMSCAGRTFKDLGRKMLPLRPLANQQVHAQDSVLGSLIENSGRGLKGTYAEMIRKAFHADWWAGDGLHDGYTQMESNFSLFWGLAIMAYESTLVSDDAPVDRLVGWAGTPPDANALRPAELRGLGLFRGKALCVSCHKGAEFTSAATGLQPHRETNLTEQMFVGKGQIGLYDNGFYNIGVRPTVEDLGVGGMDPFGHPLSISRQYLDLLRGKPAPDAFFVRPCLFAVRTDAKECWTPPDPERTRTGVDGAFKTPTLRNIALTQPYFHNGSRFTLEQVVEFYNRGGDRRGPDGNDTSGYGSPNAPGGGPSNSHPNIRPLGLTREEQEDLVAFLRYGLTDRRVACRKAPFDHPSLDLPNGHAGNERRVRAANGRAVDEFITLPATGSTGVADADCLRNDNGTLLNGMTMVAALTLPIRNDGAATDRPGPTTARVGAGGAPAGFAATGRPRGAAVPGAGVPAVDPATTPPTPAPVKPLTPPEPAVTPAATPAATPQVPTVVIDAATTPITPAPVTPASTPTPNVPVPVIPASAAAPTSGSAPAIAVPEPAATPHVPTVVVGAVTIPITPAPVTPASTPIPTPTPNVLAPLTPASAAAPASASAAVVLVPALATFAAPLGTVRSAGGATAVSGAVASASPSPASSPSAASGSASAPSTGGAAASGNPSGSDFSIAGFRSFSFGEVASVASPLSGRDAVAPEGAGASQASVARAREPELPAQSAVARAGVSGPTRLRELQPPPPASPGPEVTSPPASLTGTPTAAEPDRRLVVTSGERSAVRATLAEPELVAQGPAVAAPVSSAPAPAATKNAAPAIDAAKGSPPAPEANARVVDLQAWNPAAAPRLEFDNLDGTPFDAGVLRGKRVLLNFWAVWCLPCREEIPALQRLANSLKGQNVEVILVNVGDSRAAIDRFLEKVPTGLRILRTRGAAARLGDWNIVALPGTALLDPSGRPRWRAIGRVDGKASEALIAKRLAEMGRVR